MSRGYRIRRVAGNLFFSHLLDRCMTYGVDYSNVDERPTEYYHRVAFGLYYRTYDWMPLWWME